MKFLVSTTGNFMLRSTYTGEEAQFNRISLVSECGFYQEKIALGLVKVHARDIPDEKTDAEWLAWLTESDNDEELAVASFVSEPAPEEK